MEKDLRLQAQHRDFQAQQVTNTLELMCQELEALKEAQSGPNPMDISLTNNAPIFLYPPLLQQKKKNVNSRKN